MSADSNRGLEGLDVFFFLINWGMTKFISKTYPGVINAKSKPFSRHAETLRSAVSASNKKGFTLIELLVVVLIIGILASVALPQYEKAVMKARSAEAMTVLKKLGDNMEMFILSGGSNMNISCEAVFDGFPEGENDCAFSTKNFNFATAFGILLAEEKNGNYVLAFLPPAVKQFGFEQSELGRWCMPSTDKGTAFCKSLSGGKAPQTLSFGSDASYPF